MKDIPELDVEGLKQDLFGFLLENTPDQVYFKDTRGRFLRVSRAVARLFAASDPSELVGKSDFDFWSKETAESARADEMRILETGEPMVGKVEKLVYPDGRVRWDYTTKVPLRDSAGNIIGICGINKDFTPIKEMEDALREERNRLRAVTAELEAKNAQFRSDLHMAREIQEALLPHQHLHAGGHPGSLAFACCYRPAAVVGGDFFHILQLGHESAGVLICDVMGHGLRAALITAIIRTCLEQLRPALEDPGRLLRELNQRLRIILKHIEEPFIATALYMVADPSAGEIRFSNAGHPSPIRMKAGKADVEIVIEADYRPSCALGLFDKTDYTTLRWTFEPGDRIILFTDGLYEADSPHGTEFGLDALVESFRSHSAAQSDSLFAAVIEDVCRFTNSQQFEDDVCIVAVESTK